MPTARKKILQKGEVYIGVIIALGLFLILSQAIITLVISAYDLVSYTRARVTAKQIATEKMETLRNLPFDQVGTIQGIPPGVILQTENVARNGLTYQVRTRVEYVDDQFDGFAPTDTVPNDYKRARIDVSWGGIAASNGTTVTLITDISPLGIEEAEGGGTLSILVFNSLGEPVPQADIRIVASSVTPPVDYSTKTNANGRVILPGAPACTNACYQIFASKENFSTERTYSTSEIANPAKPNVSVLESQVTEVSFAIDQVTTVNFSTRDTRENAFAPLGGQTIHMRGNKVLGTDATDAPIYKYDQDITTDVGGQFSITDMEWDIYTLTLPSTSTKDIAGTKPLNPVSIEAGQTMDILVSLAPKTNNRVLHIFVDPADTQIASVSARFTNLSTFEATSSSGLDTDPDYGQIFWPDLENGTYLLEASAAGFATHSGNTIVNGYVKETVILTPQ